MVKAPVAGAVKTRLAREAGAVAATRFYRHATAALLGRIGRDARWRTVLAVAPDIHAGARFWPCGLARRGQGLGGLGQRMQRLMDDLPPGPVVIVGSDIPEIRASDIALAFAAVGRHGAVCGPSPDGGYWLFGLKRSPSVPRAFANVRWSSPFARADTLANFKDGSVALVAELADVDLASGLASLGARACRRILPERRHEQETEDMSRGQADSKGQTAPPPPEMRAAGQDRPAPQAAPERYSLAQVLNAGRRAEASGHREYAVQFYSHLSDHHPDTAEGKEAKEGLERLSDRGRKLAPIPARAALFPDPSPPSPARDLRPVAKGEGLARLSYRGSAGAAEPPDEASAAPPPRKNYGLGKFLARLLTGFGLFLVFTGIIFPLAALAGQRLGPFSIDISGIPLAVILAPFALGLGIGMMVASQAAFAVFDQAEGLRLLRALERERQGKGL